MCILPEAKERMKREAASSAALLKKVLQEIATGNAFNNRHTPGTQPGFSSG